MMDAPHQADTPHHAPVDAVPLDVFGRIEARGVETIPDGERHGHPRELFMVWAASNVTFLYVVLGGALIGLGLDVWQSMAAVTAGNLFWALVGVLSISGPAAGAPSSVITRAMFGIRGNRAVVALTGWGVSVAYEAINLSVGALGGFALLEALGVAATMPVKLAVILVTAIATLVISVYGHATIVRLSLPFALFLTVCFVGLAAFVAPKIDFGFVPPHAPHGLALIAAFLSGTTVIASGPLSWGTAADYARYLPIGASGRGIMGWTFLGGFLPSILLGGLGVLAGTAIDMSDPQSAFAAILPGWFDPAFLVAVIVGSMTNNILTAYSSGLSLQAMGVKANRAVTVLFDGAVGVGLAIYGLFAADFLDTLKTILDLSVSLLGPTFAIYAVDIAMRHNRYDRSALHDEAPHSPFWFGAGFNWAGIAALSIGTGAALLCADTSAFTGPVSTLLAGADLSPVAGPLVAAALYWAMTRATRRAAAQSSIRPIPPAMESAP